VKIKKSRCQIKLYGAVKETNLIPVLGSFEALIESKRKMKVVTWQLIKGDTQTAPLLSYEDGKDPGMILVSNAISKEVKQSEDTSHSHAEEAWRTNLASCAVRQSKPHRHREMV